MSLTKSTSRTGITDPVTGLVADVETISGKERLLVATLIDQVNVTQGQDPIPDHFFTITVAGAVGDTIRYELDATTIDTTSPDSDLGAVDTIYTLVAGDVGDERALAKSLSVHLNANAGFIAALVFAEAINGTDTKEERAIVYITTDEKRFSLGGEFHERPGTAITLTTTGATTIVIDTAQRSHISRTKPTSLARDPKNKHRLGILGISGSVRIRGSSVDQLFQEEALNGGSSNLAVNGSSTPVVFKVIPNAAGGLTKVVEQIKLASIAGNIKVQANKFLSINSSLTNGLFFELIKDGTVVFSINMQSTFDYLSRFAVSTSDFALLNQAGGDFIEAVFDLIKKNIVFELDPGSTDEVKITTRDNLTNITQMSLIVEGFEE